MEKFRLLLLTTKKYKPTKQTFWCTKNLHGSVWNSETLDYSELSNIILRAVKGEYFAKGTEKSKILGNLLNKEMENLEDHGCIKVQDLVDKEKWFPPVTHSNTRPHFTVRSARQRFFGVWILQHIKL